MRVQIKSAAPRVSAVACAGLACAGLALAELGCGKEEQKPPQEPAANVEKPARSTALSGDEVVELPEDLLEEGEEEPAPSPKKTSVSKKPRRNLWDCDGSLDVAKARRALQKYRKQVRTCYERRLRVDNTLQGTLALTLRVDPKGQVSKVRSSGSLEDGPLLSCIQGAAKTWTLPRPTGRCALLEIPFSLSPRF